MVRVWLLQANPERYDIDGALGALDRINWRVPQHTAEIDVDDIAVLWRSGRKAGIVGLGRMLSAPAADICFPEEKPFLRQPEPGKATGSESETDRVTRAPVGVRRTGFVPKQEVASSVLARHHFLRAPMGTVFPLNTAEWSTVRMLVAADPPQEQGWDHEQGALPRPFAWQERSGRVHQIPGGVAGYEATLRKVLAHVRDASPGQPALHGFLIREFAIAASYAEHMTQFLGKASLLRWSESTAALTHHAEHWLATGDRDYLVALLHSRVRFVGELLGELRQPTNAMALRRAAHQHYGMHWTTG